MWHHQFNGHELGQTPGDGEGQRGMACCSPGVSKSWTQLGNWKQQPCVYDFSAEIDCKFFAGREFIEREFIQLQLLENDAGDWCQGCLDK